MIEGLPASFPPPNVHEKAPAAAALPDYSLPPADVPCPYKGLVPFEPEDSEIFFGREELVSSLVQRLEDAAFLAVVGPSGSGKSSLVRAGVVPELERGEKRVRICDHRAGRAPLEKIIPGAGADLVVVDQFEEVFTLCRDEDERFAFVEVCSTPRSKGAASSSCCAPTSTGTAPHTRAWLRRSRTAGADRPDDRGGAAAGDRTAGRAGRARFEPGLADSIVRDIAGEPGALPLLSHSLLETWKRRSGRMLTILGYLQSGAVRGAIAKTAETVYQESLTPEQKTLARNIFLRLTELGEGTEDTRRRVRVGERHLDPSRRATSTRCCACSSKLVS